MRMISPQQDVESASQNLEYSESLSRYRRIVTPKEQKQANFQGMNALKSQNVDASGGVLKVGFTDRMS